MVLSVPRLILVSIGPPSLAKARSSSVAPGRAAARRAARQSLGTTSKPTPGRSATPAARAASPRPEAGDRIAVKTAISPVMSR